MNNWIDYLPSPYLLGIFIGGVLFAAVKVESQYWWAKDFFSVSIVLIFGRLADKITDLKAGSQDKPE